MKAGPVIVKTFIAAVGCLIMVYGLARLDVIRLPRALDPLALPDLTAPPGWLTPIQLKTLDFNFANCELAMAAAGLAAKAEASGTAPANCSKAETITVARLWKAKLRPEQTRCNIAARLYMWERHVLQPEAQRAFGSPVSEITHFGSYACRTMRGRSSMSEHATANAFDIAGFTLADGRRISVLKNWPGNDREARFLRTARAGLCDYFNLVLSPDYNADHADHFHVDMGTWQNCR